jgi:site-specific DNA-methyltransferase (adenine-specific)
MKRVPISQVIPNPTNPRIIKDDKFKKLTKSIQEFPEMLELRPIVVDSNMVVLGGNMRLKACIAAGLKEVPIIVADNLTEQQQAEFIIKDNVGFGEWDWDLLANQWDVEALEDWGLELPFDNTPVLEAEEDDYEAPSEIQTDIVLGDLIEIGQHRLLCGDSTDSDAVARLMDEQKADMLFTDPPYLMNFEGGIHADGSKSFNAKHGKIKNDKMTEQEGDDFLDAINSNISLFVKGAFYICFYRLKLGKYFSSLDRTGLEVRALITWDKGNHTLSNSDYMSKCEHIFYGWVKEHNFYGGKNGVDIWNIDRTKKNELHPTMKPIPLCEKALSDASKINDIVLDLFLGSGSTMVAAHQLNRKCYGMELDPKYCQVIVDRMQKLDPSLDIKINGKPYGQN